MISWIAVCVCVCVCVCVFTDDLIIQNFHKVLALLRLPSQLIIQELGSCGM